jgi:crotonobetainyl-CoA:carnitine CoA-transferase CaiB-like acyl-CoA transferase
MKRLPLEGVRIIDLTVVFAGPFATWLLGSMGAEVIMVDSIHHWPDMRRFFMMWPTPAMMEGRDPKRYPNREYGERPWNRSAFFTRVGWNKKSCCIHLGDPKGKEVFKRLVAVSDVLIENNSAKAMDHLALGPEVLMKVNPRLICINMPSYGRQGPYKDYVGWGDNAEALTGHHWVRGYDDEIHPLHNTGVYHMDSSGGATAALAAIMGLRKRRQTGKGTAIDFAQIESFMPQLGEIYMDYAWNGRVQRTLGNRHPTAVQGCYRCRGEDAWVNITINNEEEWQGLCQAMDHPLWTKEEAFTNHENRRRNHDAFDQRLEEWTIKFDKFEAFMILQNHGVPAGPVYYEADTYRDPHLNARGFFQNIDHAETGSYRYPGFLWKMSETPMTVRNPPCTMGEHNEYVFKEVLGMSEEEIATLTEEKVIGGDRYVWA